MSEILHRSQSPTAIRCVSGAFLSLVLLTTPAVILAHGRHGNEFQGGTATTPAVGKIQVDAPNR